MPTANKPESTYIYRPGTAPNTRVATSQKNKIYTYPAGKNQFQQAGIITEFGIDESRGIDVARGIGMGDQIAELVPSVTETSLSATATLLYAMNLFQLMGYKAGVDGLVRSLKHHRWPFDVKQELVFSYLASLDTASADGLEVSGFKNAITQPQSTNGIDVGESNIKALFTFFEGCWMESYGTSFASESGMVTNNCGIKVSDVVDGTTLYGEYMNTGLAPGVDGNSVGKGSSIRFGNGPNNLVGLLSLV